MDWTLIESTLLRLFWFALCVVAALVLMQKNNERIGIKFKDEYERIRSGNIAVAIFHAVVFYVIVNAAVTIATR